LILPRLALDTNVVTYSEGLERDPADRAKTIVSRLLMEAVVSSGDEFVIPAQVLAETHRVLVRRGGLSPGAASAAAIRLGELGAVAPTSASVLDAAFAIARDHGLQIYDAIILAAAGGAGCDLLLSEDLHDGFAWRGVTVTNPFRATPHPFLAQLLTNPAG
jgi:predicted nucleic acid-binding protein